MRWCARASSLSRAGPAYGTSCCDLQLRIGLRGSERCFVEETVSAVRAAYGAWRISLGKGGWQWMSAESVLSVVTILILCHCVASFYPDAPAHAKGRALLGERSHCPGSMIHVPGHQACPLVVVLSRRLLTGWLGFLRALLRYIPTWRHLSLCGSGGAWCSFGYFPRQHT